MAAQALQLEFGLQDDGILMRLSKQSELTKVGLSAPDEREHQKNSPAAAVALTLMRDYASP